MKKDDILDVSNEEKRIAFDLYQALKDIEEQYTGETIAGDPSPQNLDPSDRRQGTLMASGDFPEFETYADVIDAYNSGVAVEPGESLTDYIKKNNIKIKEIDMDPLGDLEKTFKGAAGGRVKLGSGAGVIDYGKKYLKYKDRPTQERLNKIIEDLREGGAMSADAALDLALKQIREE